MFLLGVEDEPVTAVWALLAGMQLRHPKLLNLDAAGRRAIANARQLVPYSSQTAWMKALRDYSRISEDWRNYDFRTDNLDGQLIIEAKRSDDAPCPEHEQLYQECLTTELPFRQRVVNTAQVEQPYRFKAEVDGDSTWISITIPSEAIKQAGDVPDPWFSQRPIHKPLTLSMPELQGVAERLDLRETTLADQYRWRAEDRGNWRRRYATLNLHVVEADHTLGPSNAHTLQLNGFTHLAGMVGAGKSTLALLLAGHILFDQPDLRMTLVVGDVQTATTLANQINWWVYDSPESDDPVAVPIMGRSRRDMHLRGFYQSRDYLAYQERRQPHWGERWLNTACSIQGLVLGTDASDVLLSHPLLPGHEPCQSLHKPRSKHQKTQGSSYLCPLFAGCSAMQLYRDMPRARIWITTPGALATSPLPRQLESRAIKLGELIYEQSDLVIFDEADTMIAWFDGVFAEHITLTDGRDGLLDRTGEPTERFMRSERVPPHLTQRWVGAHRHTLNLVTTVLTMLHPVVGHAILRAWVKQSYFTPYTLCYRLARRMMGLPEFDERQASAEVVAARDAAIAPVWQIFETLLNADDPLAIAAAEGSLLNGLVRLLQQINSNGESAADEQLHAGCYAWILKAVPDVEQHLERREAEVAREVARQPKQLRGKRGGAQDNHNQIDTISTLAHRLQFTLSSLLLDRHSRIVFYEWFNRPSLIDEEPPYRRMPNSMLDILPLPATGRQFGTYYAHEPGTGAQRTGHLSLFAYTNIGRTYVLNYHRLLSDFDGQPGPNVLALSGTSFLPHSTAFHVSDPQAVLLPEAAVREAIAHSTFCFLPQPKRGGGGCIVISGAPEEQKPGLFYELVTTLAGITGGALQQELAHLETLGAQQPDVWGDRARLLLLVNSYDQALWAASELQRRWHTAREQIFYLHRTDASAVVTDQSWPQDALNALRRTDIESFAQTKGRILVAPMNAIGRGFNIRNAAGKAAFGTVYFLTRPYPHPHDTRAIAQELNRRMLDWALASTFEAWNADGVLGQAQAVRRLAGAYWRSIEQRTYYSTLYDNERLCSHPRADLAATTAGYIVQAVGRLLRGGVPFHAYFVDAAWAPNSAHRPDEQLDTPRTSLLVAVIQQLAEYAKDEGTVGWALYRPLADALEQTSNLCW